MTAVIITASLDRSWIRPLTGLRGRGVACVVLSIDAASADSASANRYRAVGHGDETGTVALTDADQRALRHALAEHDLRTYRIVAGTSLSEQLAG
jgi:hypothetical protein